MRRKGFWRTPNCLMCVFYIVLKDNVLTIQYPIYYLNIYGCFSFPLVPRNAQIVFYHLTFLELSNYPTIHDQKIDQKMPFFSTLLNQSIKTSFPNHFTPTFLTADFLDLSNYPWSGHHQEIGEKTFSQTSRLN